jgi:hypothetical protein
VTVEGKQTDVAGKQCRQPIRRGSQESVSRVFGLKPARDQKRHKTDSSRMQQTDLTREARQTRVQGSSSGGRGRGSTRGGGLYTPNSTAQYLPPTLVGVHLCPSPSSPAKIGCSFDTLYSTAQYSPRPTAFLTRPPAPDQASKPFSTLPASRSVTSRVNTNPQKASHTQYSTPGSHTHTHTHTHAHGAPEPTHLSPPAPRPHQIPDRPTDRPTDRQERKKQGTPRYTSRCTRPSTRREYCTCAVVVRVSYEDGDGWLCGGWCVPVLSLPRSRRRGLHAPGRLPRYILCTRVCGCGCLGGRAGGVPAACCWPFVHPLFSPLQGASWLGGWQKGVDGLVLPVVCQFVRLDKRWVRLSWVVVRGRSGMGYVCSAAAPADRRFRKCDGPGIGSVTNDRA